MNESILKLKELLDKNCKIEKIYPSVLGSDAEINVVTVEVRCPDKNIRKIRAYRDEARDLREFVRTRVSDTK